MNVRQDELDMPPCIIPPALVRLCIDVGPSSSLTRYNEASNDAISRSNERLHISLASTPRLVSSVETVRLRTCIAYPIERQ